MARRSRDLAGLAALGALGYMALRGGKQAPAPVEDRFTIPMPEADAPQGVRIRGPQETFMGLDDVSGSMADTGGVGRSNVRAADQSEMAPPVLRAQAAAAGPATARSAPARLASPDADSPSAGRTRAASAAPAAAPMSLRQQLTQTTLGTPTGPAPNAPSIYAGPEAWAAYRQQQAAERAAQPPTQQGSARNIVQQMREKDKAVLAAVRRRQAEEEAAAQAAREAAAERRREARRVEPPAVGLENPYYGRSGAQRTAALRAKGGSVKAKSKKMASGGMSSASKRADGIATKGKTKCKMY